jgi:uroporphyrinogen-III synthase
LTGTHAVVVTRPAGTNAKLVAKLRSLGETVFEFPAIKIRPLPLHARAEATLRGIADFDVAVFISPSAVARWFAIANSSWPAGTKAAAVGPGTAAALRSHGVTNVMTPGAGAGAQALLARADLASPDGKRVLVIAGQNGSDALIAELASRGAQTTRLALYRREPPTNGRPLFDWLASHPNALLLVTSLTALDNLARLGDERDKQTLLHVPLVASSPRVVQQARRFGYREVIRAADATDAALAGAVAKWRKSQV